MNKQPAAVIIGAGPAGLTAAYELATRTDIKPLVPKADLCLGGISRTVAYKGNRIDIGGHRLFSKSRRVMDWWGGILPLQGAPAADQKEMEISYHNLTAAVHLDPTGPDPDRVEQVMLIRPRVSRILFRGQLFDYPLKPNPKTLRQLGVGTSIGILASYARSRLAPIRPEQSLEAFFINRFGRRFLERFENLFPLGRNGMHRYNNQDHSMLTAMPAVDNIVAGVTDKANIWEVNTESDYHEEKGASN